MGARIATVAIVMSSTDRSIFCSCESVVGGRPKSLRDLRMLLLMELLLCSIRSIRGHLQRIHV